MSPHPQTIATAALSGVSSDLAEWHARFAEALTARDAAGYGAFLAEDCTLQINNGLPTYSRPAIERAFSAYLQLFQTLTIDVLALHGSERDLGVETLLNYVVHDGSTEVVPCAYFVTRRSDGLVTSIRVYGNASRLFKPFIRLT